MISDVVYVNTLDVEALPNAAALKRVLVTPPPGYQLLGSFTLGVYSDSCDAPGVRISAQLRAVPIAGAEDDAVEEIKGDYLYLSPYGQLRAAPERLPAPYPVGDDEELWLSVKVTNRTAVTVKGRATVYAWFVKEEETI
jgi:hypothetical protein